MRAAAASYAANCALGTLVFTRVLDTSGYRWVHHAIFVTTAALTASAVAAALLRRHPAGIALAPALLPLAVIPFAGHRRHIATALAAAPWYTTALAATGRH